MFKQNTEVSFENTVHLMKDFETKKKHFDDTISKLKNFNPSLLSPNVRNATISKNKSEKLDNLDVTMILNQMK